MGGALGELLAGGVPQSEEDHRRIAISWAIHLMRGLEPLPPRFVAAIVGRAKRDTAFRLALNKSLPRSNAHSTIVGVVVSSEVFLARSKRDTLGLKFPKGGLYRHVLEELRAEWGKHPEFRFLRKPDADAIQTIRDVARSFERWEAALTVTPR